MASSNFITTFLFTFFIILGNGNGQLTYNSHDTCTYSFVVPREESCFQSPQLEILKKSVETQEATIMTQGKTISELKQKISLLEKTNGKVGLPIISTNFTCSCGTDVNFRLSFAGQMQLFYSLVDCK